MDSQAAPRAPRLRNYWPRLASGVKHGGMATVAAALIVNIREATR